MNICSNYNSFLQTVVFCIVTPRSLASLYQRFEGTCWLHLQDQAWRWMQNIPAKGEYPPTRLPRGSQSQQLPAWDLNIWGGPIHQSTRTLTQSFDCYSFCCSILWHLQGERTYPDEEPLLSTETPSPTAASCNSAGHNHRALTMDRHRAAPIHYHRDMFPNCLSVCSLMTNLPVRTFGAVNNDSS
jgi:hypothetical protein